MKCSDEQFNSRIEQRIFFFLFVISFLLCMFQFFDHDEFEAVHTAWKMLHGQIMYIDFFQQKPPFFHYTLMPMIKFFGEVVRTLFICKFYMFILFSIIIYATCLISNSVFGYKVKFLTPAILLSCTFFTDKLTEIRPDVPYIMLGVLAVAFLYKNKSLNKINLVASAVCLGLSFVILQKAVFYIIPIIGILCFRLYRKKIKVSDLLLYIVVIIATIIPFYIYLFRIITFQEYYFFNVLINYKFLGSFSPVQKLLILLSENIVFSIITICGFFKLKGYRQHEIGFLALILFISVFTVNVPNKQYFLPAIPFFAMIAANFIYRTKLLRNYSSVVLLAIVAYPTIFFIKQIFQFRNVEQIEKIEYVLSQTTLDDKVYDGSIYFNIFRDDINYFWFSVRPKGVVDTYKSLKNIQYDVYRDILFKKPKIIYAKYLDIRHPLIQQYYTPVSKYNRLYIRREVDE